MRPLDPSSWWPAAAAALLLAAGAGASWRFGATSAPRLDYGDLPLVTDGSAGAFSVFCTAKLDQLNDDDGFLFGKLTSEDRGWQLVFDRAVEDTGHANRFKFWVSNGAGAETERYAANEAVTGDWYAIGGSYEWNEAPLAPGADSMTLYVNGTDDSEPPRLDAGQRPLAHTDPVTIGGTVAGSAAGAAGRIGYGAVWDGYALTAQEHAQLAAGADPRAIAPSHLVFFARLEDDDAEELLGGTIPAVATGAAFSPDRFPTAKPLLVSLGDARPDAMRLLATVGRAAELRVEYTPDDFPGAVTAPQTPGEDADFVAGFDVTGLAPATLYRYRLLADGAVVATSESAFETAPDERAVFSFVFGSCTRFDETDPPYGRFDFDTLRGIADRGPDFVVHAGDLWYSDLGGENEQDPFDAWFADTIEAFARKARETLSVKEFARLQPRYPLYSMPDDHEWRNDLSNIPGLEGTALERYLRGFGRVLNWQFTRNPPRLPKAMEDGGLWYSFSYADVDFFFLDLRTQRPRNTSENNEDKKILGPDDRQLQDLVDWLQASRARFKVILSPGMISRFGTTGNDSWGSSNGYGVNAQAVIDRIDQFQDVVYFGGDVHWSGATRLREASDGDPAHALYELISGPFAGHLATTPDTEDEDLLFAYDGRNANPERRSYIHVTVDTVSTPASITARVISHAPNGAETVEYTHPRILSRRTCPGDLDADGVIGFNDLLLVLGAWGTCAPEGHCPGDADESGTVDFDDILEILNAWGECAALGGCCFGDGTCADLLAADCAQQGGFFQGPTACGTGVCDPSDDCGDAPSVGDGTYAFSTEGASDDGPSPECDEGNGRPFRRDVWVRYVAPRTGTATASVCDADFNSKLAVYDVTDCPGAILACSDDACGANGTRSATSFDVVEGETYLVRIGGRVQTGNGTLVLTSK